MASSEELEEVVRLVYQAGGLQAFTVVSIHPGASRRQIEATCGWDVRYAADVAATPAPTALELKTLRALQERTRIAHQGSE